MQLSFSFVIPVYNRPDEIRELLQSLVELEYGEPFEVLIVEDGSTVSSERVVKEFTRKLPLRYLLKENTGPGKSRNYGMARARGNYFIILDSDCLVPRAYLKTVQQSLAEQYADGYGGPDTAHSSFTRVQKAINFAMTSVLTTGGIRGSRYATGRFQPRSFNMGISRKAFEATGGFGNIHPGEDPDLSIRLWEKGFSTKLIRGAFVYHKRRVSFGRFFRQVVKFGKVRPILTSWYPSTARITYWFPVFFCAGILISLLAACFSVVWPLLLVLLYLFVLLIEAMIKTGDIAIAFMAVAASLVQFLGYGYGFLMSVILINFSRRKPQEIFPELFF